ncbi:glucose-6-phosphate dehydrogenase [Calidifontibacter sp. DB0510]|uniref:Glucose-6-phosphate dehydrogenase n=1 Tax=Metallococcus carri TaxID=1656884 RepID=A0A967B1N1_9MICO|nr:glucose-6-phosphate dehydrogenase [Metallococcus carri]NHN57164.1 glucose-6-phosphate dehydrogenase [Metallococcus carri]NOP38033.1 glucose-6-phosphate dehydrogenase [Calidifontibacter sp. DB2511S]
MTSTKPVTLLVLGAGGDLTKRLLLPGLGSLLKVETGRQVTVVGADRAELTDKAFGALVRGAFEGVGVNKRTTDRIVRTARYQQADLLDPAALADLIAGCGDDELVIYFALPPSIAVKVCAELQKIGLPKGTRLGLEKPFGTDEASARAFNKQLQRLVPEEQIFRVDHFLGVATVLNLIGLRFANRILQPIWNAEHIERVEIAYDEDLALEGRAGYYDGAGALRDMLQSHLLQVLAIFAMEPIASLEPQELADLKAQVLRATHLWEDDPTQAKRARYTAGKLGRRKIPSYVDEQGVDPKRKTETLAQMTVEVRNNRWTGVPIVLRSGKALGQAHKQIVAYLRPVAHLPSGFIGEATGDVLIIDVKPGAVSFRLTMNAEGDPLDLEHKLLTAELADGQMTAYGEVLRHMLDGNQLLSVRADAAELCWHIVAPVLAAFEANKVPLEEYPAGSTGPDGWLPKDSVLLDSAYGNSAAV